MSSKLATDASVACANFVVVVVDVTGSTHSAVDAAPETAVLQSLAVFINSYLFMSRSHDLALVAVGSDRSDIAFRSARELLRSDLDEAKGEMSIADIATASLLESIRRNTTSHGAPSTEGVGYVAMAKGLSQAMCVINRRQQYRSDQPLCIGGRILVVQRAQDQPDAYNAVMNAIFSAQKAGVLIDSLVLPAASQQAGSSFLQQAAFLTGGLYLCPTSTAPAPQARGGTAGGAVRSGPPTATDLTSLLLCHCLSDADTRAALKTPPLRSLDFRAACSCHGVQVDLAYMCSVCLSLQCEATDACGTCGTPAAK